MYLCLFFGGLFLYLGFWGLDLETWSARKEKEKQPKRKKQYIAYRGLILLYHRGKGPLGGTLAKFFQPILEVVPDFQETNVYERNFATFFVISTLPL